MVRQGPGGRSEDRAGRPPALRGRSGVPPHRRRRRRQVADGPAAPDGPPSALDGRLPAPPPDLPLGQHNGDNALDVLVPYLAGPARIYVFGQKVATENIVHDVHCNQGDPAGTQWYPQNGIWQDGAVMCQGKDGRVVVWQIKFNTQSLHTDDDGHPV
ncbi:DUF2278 family protein [Streptomyces roseoverticillatus]|uniref:DUF2278 family protein n=1 Tax=Streptomyces roseoverticillatus TaxID=66429 RepID=UPI0027E4B9E1|nr:DUF2278 family protein [Streptomyces roseoverticillatus]